MPIHIASPMIVQNAPKIQAENGTASIADVAIIQLQSFCFTNEAETAPSATGSRQMMACTVSPESLVWSTK